MQRKLATIMVADFVGSTTAMQADEEGAISRIDAALETVRAVVRRHDGRVFGTAGDAILAEFSSPVSALRSAIEARAEIAGLPGGSDADMRFGLHVADVVIVGSDLRGDGINVTARIEASALPGAIEVSASLYDQVRRVSPCAFEAIGERTFKGIAEPIGVYRVTEVVDRHLYQFAPTRNLPSASQSPRSNSIAVARFDVAPGDIADQCFLAEGITDDLTLELSRLKGLFVSSRSAATALTTKNPVEIGRILGVGYVISGSIRQAGDDLRVNIALTETVGGIVIWSERIRRPFRELLDVMDEIVARIAATVSGRIEQSELAAVRLKRPENMTAYEYYLRGLDHHRMTGLSDSHIQEAMSWFERSMKADPSFGRPFAMHVCAWSNLPTFDLHQAEQQVAHDLALDPTDPEAHRIMGAILMKSGDFVSSRYHHVRAQELAPNDAYILGRSAAYYVYAGEAEVALELLHRAEILDPFLPVWITEERVAALYSLNRFEDMMRVALALPFQTRRTLLYQVAANVACHKEERAETLVRQALSIDPGLSAIYIRMQETFADASVIDTLVERNCAAGLPLTPHRSSTVTKARAV